MKPQLKAGTIVVLLLISSLAVSLSTSLPAHASQPPPLPPGWPADKCWTDTLPSHDPKYPDDQLILICLPQNWNGTLFIYAHGYVPSVAPLALPMQELGPLQGAVLSLVDSGFAFATTSYHKNGYAIQQADADLRNLVLHFNNHVAPQPAQHVLLFGASEGGLITAIMIERHPKTEDGGFFDGGLALCGPVGGMPYQVKYLGDFRVVFDHYFRGVLPGGVVTVPVDAWQSWGDPNLGGYSKDIAAAIYADAAPPPFGSAGLNAASLFAVTGAGNPGDPSSYIPTAEQVLWYSIWGTNDMIATAGGNPYSNKNTIYAGSTDDAALNAGVERVTADARAVAYVRRFYQTTGNLRVPLVTLHNEFDPAVPFAHEAMYQQIVAGRGRSQDLYQITASGYGHCNFSFNDIGNAAYVLLTMVGILPSP